MLQIISGKFFKSTDRHIHEAKGITYSNYSWVRPIETCVATLEPVDLSSQVSPYVISYVEQIEKGGILVGTDGSEIVQQFQLLCIFGLNAFFDIDRTKVEINCRENPRSSGDHYLPSRFISRFFEPEIHGQKAEIEAFIKFVDKVIGLPRKKYLGVISCLNNFSHALHVLNYNIDLAYSMLVYSLESLSQSFDDFEPTWEDYDPKIRNKLDSDFSKIDSGIAENIRNILLESSNLRLQKRFIDFITDNLHDSFFTDEAINIKNSLRPSELKQVLKNAYGIRSGYVHQLKPIQEQLRNSKIAEGDVFHWDNEPYLTFAGLVRLAHHVINNFICDQESLTTEDYDWRRDLPGIVMMKLAPQYWIAEHDRFVPSHAREKFSGFLTEFQNNRLSDSPLTDLRKLLEKYESLIPTAEKQDKIAMLSLYHLYNSFIVPEARRPEYKKFLEKYDDALDECCIESMIVHLLYNQKWPWDTEDCISHYDNYTKNKFSKNALSIPPVIELCLIVTIANMWLKAGAIEKYNDWLHTACLEASGKPDIQKLINECKSKRVGIAHGLIFKITKDKS